MLAGLRRPTGGTIALGVERARRSLLPDTPSFDPWLTGFEVVALARALVAPELPSAGVDEALEEAGLTDAAGRRVGGYSRGMLQRLGVAERCPRAGGHARRQPPARGAVTRTSVPGSDEVSLWRLEYLRLRRSWRGPAVLVVFLLFGLFGPLTAEYLGEIVNRLGSDGIQVIVPEATLADGFAHFLGNVHQIGLIVAIAVTSSALAFDADPEVATFLRTRVPSIPRLVLT